jgi:hypothetical protein
MQIISHRGYWKELNERNTEVAFRRSFELDFGTETDVRDCCGELVISHDPPHGGEMTANTFFSLYASYRIQSWLAINIKADGLQNKIKQLLQKYDIKNYFVFDMSIPDTLIQIKESVNVFLRQSEFEDPTQLLNQADGIWLDSFTSEWYEESLITSHLQAGKKVCLVSPDLHKRPHQAFWERLASWTVSSSENFILCTDFPEDARRFFHG